MVTALSSYSLGENKGNAVRAYSLTRCMTYVAVIVASIGGKFNFDSFRRHHRITFFINMERKDYIETTIGQLNFFRWIFNNSIINYAIDNYDIIYKKMIDNNTCKVKNKVNILHNHDIIKTKCLLRFD
jgi:hypothetical protein